MGRLLTLLRANQPAPGGGGGSGYTHYRLLISANNGNTWVGSKEIEFRGEIGGPSLAWAEDQTQGFEGGGTGTGPQYAFDGSVGTPAGANGWYMNTGITYPVHIGFAFAAAVSVVQYAVHAYGGSSVDTRSLRDWKLQGSNDSTNGTDGTWTDLHTASGETGWTTDEVRVFTV